MSYTNLIMYNSVLPSYDPEAGKSKKNKGEYIDADDPKNKQKIRQLLFSGQ